LENPSLKGLLMLRIGTLLLSCLAPLQACCAEYFVSPEGKGRAGTKEAPAKDIGNLGELQPGDVINMAAGVYVGKAEAGRDEITVPVTILGGWDAAFSKRDPWGATQTILSGNNTSKNFDGGARLEINLSKFRGTGDVLIDGVIVDNAARNRYTGDGAKIGRKANPRTGEMPTPDSAGILVKCGKGVNAIVRNCIVINCAPTQGALAVWGSQGTHCTVSNNLVVNNTGVGIETNTLWRPRDGRDQAAFTVENNTVLFTWKYDAFGSINGNGIQMDADTIISATGNVFAFSDNAGVNNIKKTKGLTLKDNLLFGNLQCDYLEFNTKLDAGKIDDDAEVLSRESGGNVSEKIALEMDSQWAERYAARNVIDRKAAEADVKAADTRMNEWRSILGLPLKAADLSVDSDVWLHKLSLENALKIGGKKLNGKFGCQIPAP
jgi:hypothetical protein